MDLNDIPHEKKSFPTGVSEQVYKTMPEMDAFIEGLDFADDTDVSHGQPFERDGEFVVRVRVGDFGLDDEDFDDLEEDDQK
jgi:hypothetical protein